MPPAGKSESMSSHYYSRSLIRSAARSAGQKKYSDLMEKNKNKKILVILHLFYPESWMEIREYLLNLKGYTWDLCVTYPDHLEGKLPVDSIRRINPGTRFFGLENKGYDIGPFLHVLHQIDIDEYDVLFKMQSKGVHRRWIFIYKQLFFRRDWFLNLYEGTMGADVIHTTIDRIANDPQTGMISAQNLIVHDPAHKENLVLKYLRGMNIQEEKGYYFIAGTCFAVKPSCLREFRALPCTQDDFTPVLSSRGMSLAHVLERYMCFGAQKNGMEIRGNDVFQGRRALKRPLEKLLGRISSERLLELPVKIDDEYFLWKLDNRFVRYRMRKMKLGDLKYQMVPGEKILPLKETYPYRYLQGDKSAYEEYARLHEEKGYPAMTAERFDELTRSMSGKGYDPRNIILVNELGILRDGQHRACFLAHKYGLDHKVRVLEIENIDRIFLIWHLCPRFIRRIYYRKRYDLEI